MNKKYSAFHRYDAANWKFTKLALDNFIFLAPFRWGVAWGIVVVFTPIMLTVMIG